MLGWALPPLTLHMQTSVEIPCPPLPLDICVSVRYNQRWMVGGGWGNDLLQSGIVTAPAQHRDSPHSAPGADVTSPGLMMEQWHRHIFSLLFDWSHCQSDFFLCFHALAADDSDYIEDFNDKIGNYISKVAGLEEGTWKTLTCWPHLISMQILLKQELLPTKDWLTDNWPIEIGVSRLGTCRVGEHGAEAQATLPSSQTPLRNEFIRTGSFTIDLLWKVRFCGYLFSRQSRQWP